MPASGFSKREAQIMDALYRRGRATASEVLEDLPDPPGYSGVRKLLGILETKGHVRHERDGSRYVYVPVISSARASREALRRVLDVFFEGSLANAVNSLISGPRGSVTPEELDRIRALARAARKEGR